MDEATLLGRFIKKLNPPLGIVVVKNARPAEAIIMAEGYAQIFPPTGIIQINSTPSIKGGTPASGRPSSPSPTKNYELSQVHNLTSKKKIDKETQKSGTIPSSG